MSERSGVGEEHFTEYELYEIAVDTLVELADKRTLRTFFHSLIGFWDYDTELMDKVIKRVIAVLAIIPKDKVQ